MKKKQNDQTDEFRKQIEEWKSKYLRALADYQNLEKRVAQEKSEIFVYAAESVVAKLLPVVDTLEQAQNHLQDGGLSLALKDLAAFLSSQGVAKLEVVGKPFDPTTMECIEVVDGPDNIVVEETRSGYTLNGKIMRVAQVKVGKKHVIARSVSDEAISHGHEIASPSERSRDDNDA